MALLKLNVILLAPLPIPPLPVIVMVGTNAIVLVPARTRFKEITNWAKIGFC
jgi:hypothetical protein